MDNIRKLFICCYPTTKEKENDFEDFFDKASESSHYSKKITNNKINENEQIVYNMNNKNIVKDNDKEIYINSNNGEFKKKENTLQESLSKKASLSNINNVSKKSSFLGINPIKNENSIRKSLFSKNNSLKTITDNSPIKKRNTNMLSNEEYNLSFSNSKIEENTSLSKKFITTQEKKQSNEYVIIQEMANEKNSEESSSIITDIEVQQNNKLELEDIEGNFLGNKKVIISASGLESIQTHRKVGVTSFGISRDHFIKDIKTNYLILPKLKDVDFEVNLKEICNSSNIIFIISFNKYLKSYILKPITSITDKVYMFYKLFKDSEISINSIISLGEFIISILVNQDLSLKIQVLNKSKILHDFIFKPYKNKFVRIGRSRINEISIQSNSFSKTQCSIYFNEENKKWYIQDGHDNIRSKNGTWVYLNHELEILEDIFIKIQEHFFAIHICK